MLHVEVTGYCESTIALFPGTECLGPTTTKLVCPRAGLEMATESKQLCR